MKVLVDMNLSPGWVAEFKMRGIDAQHWSEVGDPRAPDADLMAYARGAGAIVFTHDLDFGVLLALTRASGPSVVQLRAQSILPQDSCDLVVAILEQHNDALLAGALVSIDGITSRVRILPLK